MPTIIKSALPVILLGLLAGCAGGGGYYSSGGYGGGYGYDQPYQPGGYYYAPSAYSYNFSYTDRDYGGVSNYWRYHHQDHNYSGGNDWWRNNHQNHDYGRTYSMNRDQGHWQNPQGQPNWKKKNWSQ